MALRGKKPEEIQPRLKALLFGPAGVGKTRAAIQMPKPYLIDTEGSARHYGAEVSKRGGVIYQTSSMEDTIEEVRALANDKHDYLTLVIDPFTTIFETEMDKAESMVGSDFGRHVTEAAKAAKRLYSLIANLDMNVIVTSHAKPEYKDIGDKKMQRIGYTFDGWKKLDYLFDLVFEIERETSEPDSRRLATVRKTRLSKEFPDQIKFVWSYENLAKMYGVERLERGVTSVELAGHKVAGELRALIARLSGPEIERLKIDKITAEFNDLADMPMDRAVKGIAALTAHFEKGVAV